MKAIIVGVILLGMWLQPVLAARLPEAVDKMAITEKLVAITFEDADTPAEFEAALRLCQEQGIKVTFFIQGQAVANLELRKAVALGHEIGNHGMKHEYWREWDVKAIAAELSQAEKTVLAAAGIASKVVRPPYNYYEDNFRQAVSGLTPTPLIVRGVDSGDWTLGTPEAVAEKVKESVQSGMIININLKMKSAAAALPMIVQDLKQRGFGFVTVSELRSKALEPVKPPVEAAAFTVIRHVYTTKPHIALTFDDGGAAWQVNEILDILRENKVKSTFFLLGRWVKANTELVHRIAAEGHEIANHSYSHPAFSGLSAEEMREEILATEAALQESAGVPVSRLFRPPYGDYNRALLSVLRDINYRALVMWDVDTRDWTGVDADTIASRVYDNASSGGVVLFHLQGPYTGSALREVLPALAARGFTATTVSVLLAEGGR